MTFDIDSLIWSANVRHSYNRTAGDLQSTGTQAMTESIPITPSSGRQRIWSALARLPMWAVVVFAFILLFAATAWGLLRPIIRERQAIQRLESSSNVLTIKPTVTTCQPPPEPTWERIISSVTRGGTWTPKDFNVYLSGETPGEALRELRFLRRVDYASLSAGKWPNGELILALQVLRGDDRFHHGTSGIPNEWNVFERQSPRELRIESATFHARSMAMIAAMPRLEQLWLMDCSVTESHLGQLRGHPTLADLSLSRAPMTLDFIGTLESLPELTHLGLLDTEIDDRFLRELYRLRKLKSLYIEATKITDAGLASIPASVRLDRLNVDRTAITEAGLLSLKTVPQMLSLVGTKVKVTEPLKRWFLSHPFELVRLDESQLDPSSPTADELSRQMNIYITPVAVPADR